MDVQIVLNWGAGQLIRTPHQTMLILLLRVALPIPFAPRKNSAAKIIKNLSPIKAKIKKFKNGDFNIDYSSGWNGALLGIRKILQLNYRGSSNYAYYDTARGVLSLRLSGHNANGNNFSPENINISIFVALFEYEHIETSIKYTEFRITEETYNTNPQKVVFEIITAVEGALNGDLFELNNEIAEKTDYNFRTDAQTIPTK